MFPWQPKQIAPPATRWQTCKLFIFCFLCIGRGKLQTGGGVRRNGLILVDVDEGKQMSCSFKAIFPINNG